jgi:hypothetical protein
MKIKGHMQAQLLLKIVLKAKVIVDQGLVSKVFCTWRVEGLRVGLRARPPRRQGHHLPTAEQMSVLLFLVNVVDLNKEELGKQNSIGLLRK